MARARSSNYNYLDPRTPLDKVWSYRLQMGQSSQYFSPLMYWCAVLGPLQSSWPNNMIDFPSLAAPGISLSLVTGYGSIRDKMMMIMYQELFHWTSSSTPDRDKKNKTFPQTPTAESWQPNTTPGDFRGLDPVNCTKYQMNAWNKMLPIQSDCAH